MQLFKKIIISLVTCHLSLVATQNAQAFSVHHDFIAHIGIFDAGRITFEYGLTPKNYTVASAIKTNGFFNALYPFEAVFTTAGAIKNHELKTASYEYRLKSRFNRRTKELVYDDHGQPVYIITSKNDREKKKRPVALPQDTGTTTDLQTAFAKLARQYEQVNFCDSQMEIFDGKRLYSIIFRNEGKEKIEKNKFSPFAGLATKCSMHIDKPVEDGKGLLWEIAGEKPIYFWILEQEGKPFIARAEISETPLGALRIYTKNITIKE